MELLYRRSGEVTSPLRIPHTYYAGFQIAYTELLLIISVEFVQINTEYQINGMNAIKVFPVWYSG